ncbi:hypothetical protein HDU93_008326 [Gonapodya sp. JEL0774]|nr:hypothetical protein HDU93_008326 [Gonapodya sp. JEL0774]
MGRKRKQWADDDGGSSSDENDSEDDVRGLNADEREERDLFRGKRRQRRRQTEEDKMLGIFAEDSDEDDRRGGRGFRGQGKTRLDAGVRFVSGGRTGGDMDAKDENQALNEDEEDSKNGDSPMDDADSDEDSKPRVPFMHGASDSEEEGMDIDNSGSKGGIGSVLGFSREDPENERPSFGDRGRSGLGGGAGAQENAGGAFLFQKGGLLYNHDKEELSKGAARTQAEAPTPPTRSQSSKKDRVSQLRTDTPRQPSSVSSPSPSAPSPTPSPPPQSPSPRPNKPSRPSKPDHTFGTWERTTSGIGSKLLRAMGWQPGTGLGKEGAGMVKPIDVKLRPKGAGLGTIDERTEAVREQQKMMKEMHGIDYGSDDGETDDEGMKGAGRKKGRKRSTRDGDMDMDLDEPQFKPKSDSWKKTSKTSRARKPQYRTAAEIAEEEAARATPDMTGSAVPVTTHIVDMTGPGGARVRALDTLSTAADTPRYIDPTVHLPELRHNVRLLADLAQHDFVSAVRAKRSQDAAQARMEKERRGADAKIAEAREKEKRLLAVIDAVESLEKAGKAALIVMGSGAEGAESGERALSSCDVALARVERDIARGDRARYGVDAIVVSAVAPLLKRIWATWDPLIDPKLGVSFFLEWMNLMRPSPTLQDTTTYNSRSGNHGAMDENAKSMSPYEALLYHQWLPPVRRAVSTEWDPAVPDQIITLVETWGGMGGGMLSVLGGSAMGVNQESVLPDWMLAMVLDQLIMPKLLRTVASWHPTRSTSSSTNAPIHFWTQPWLGVQHPSSKVHAANNENEHWTSSLVDAVRRRLVTVLGGEWHPRESWGMEVVVKWKDVFAPEAMLSLLRRSVLPKLILTLRSDFSVNPASQDIAPLQSWVLPWYTSGLVPAHLLAAILQIELEPKWLRALWVWLSSPGCDFAAVAAWYGAWKGIFDEALRKEAAVEGMFRKGLDAMNEAALRRKDGLAVEIPRAVLAATEETVPTLPDFLAYDIVQAGRGSPAPGPAKPTINGRTAAQAVTTYRDYLEHFFAERDLTFLPAEGRHAVGSERQVFRIAEPGKKGKALLVEVDGQVMFARVGGKLVAVGGDDVVGIVKEGKSM